MAHLVCWPSVRRPFSGHRRIGCVAFRHRRFPVRLSIQQPPLSCRRVLPVFGYRRRRQALALAPHGGPALDLCGSGLPWCTTATRLAPARCSTTRRDP